MRKIKNRKLLYNGGAIASTLGIGSILASTAFVNDPKYSAATLVGGALVGVGLIMMSSNNQTDEEINLEKRREIDNLVFEDQLLSMDIDSLKKREEEIEIIEKYYYKNYGNNSAEVNFLLKKNILKERLILNSSTNSYHTTNEADKVDSEVTLQALFKLEYDYKYITFRKKALEDYEKNKKRLNSKIIKFIRK